MNRICTKCGRELPLVEFAHNIRGASQKRICISCDTAKATSRAYVKPEDGTKRCNKCGLIKPESQFHKRSDGKGRFGHCKTCHNAKKRQRYYEGKDLPPQYRWADRVLRRDNYTCQDCGLREDEIMVAHHLVPVQEDESLMFEVYNGVTLCPNCHARRHIQLREAKQKADAEANDRRLHPLWQQVPDVLST